MIVAIIIISSNIITTIVIIIHIIIIIICATKSIISMTEVIKDRSRGQDQEENGQQTETELRQLLK